MRWLSRLLRRRALDRELDTEVRFHFDEHVREAMAAGRSRREAEREARLALGGIDQTKERTRDARGTRWAEDAGQDLRFALRGLVREPAFAAVAVLTLGLGVGAATAIFSAVYPVLFEPLAYPDPDRLVALAERADDGTPAPLAFGTLLELAGRARSLESLAAHRPYHPTLTGDGEPERLDGQLVGAAYFRALGVAPALGTDFATEDDRIGGPEVLILSDGLWRSRFGGDAGIVGSVVRLDGRPATVIGVMPADFENVPAPNARIWSLLRYDTSPAGFDTREWGRHLSAIARVRPDVSVAAARLDLDAVAENRSSDFPRPPWATMEGGIDARSLRDAASAAARPVLTLLLGAVLLLLVIACVNLANLILARGERRRGELAIRAALGAGRGRLVRQLLAEGLVIAAFGGALGLVLARLGIAGLVALSPPGLTRIEAIELDFAVLVFALGITHLVALVAALAPAVGAAAHGDAGETLERSRSGGDRHRLTRRVLVVAEVALALVLLVGAGLMLRTLQHLFAIAPGFDGAGVVVMQVQVGGVEYRDDATIHRFFQEALAAVEAVPGVASAAWTSQLPLSGDSDVYGVRFAEDSAQGADGGVFRYAVGPGYFEAMRIPAIRGRVLGSGDDASSPRVAVISESLARRAFPDGEWIGRRLHLGPTDLPALTVVGVAADVEQAALGAGRTDAVYVVPEQWHFADRARWLVVRAEREPLGLAAEVEAAVWSVDPEQAIVRVQALETLVARSEARRLFALVVLQTFAVLAVVLAAVGLYGVLAGSVAERTHEIGVRSALGASRERIVAMVVRQGLTLAALGGAIGLAAAAVLSGALNSLLFGVSRLDPVTYAAVALALAAVSALACWVPAARAARVDPASTLRAD